MKKTKRFRLLSQGLCLLSFLVVSSTALNAQSCTLITGNINLGGASHDPGFQSSDPVHTTATLSNGNFVVAWETRDGVDGEGNGAFFQVFKEDGTMVTAVTMPYADINPAGTGDQGVFGPKVIALTTGFVMAWESENGPGDTGPVGDDQQDVYFRVYNNDGSAVSATTRVSVAAEEDHLEYILPLNTGGFVLLMRIDEDIIGNNLDDYFFQAFNASGVSTSGALINISGGAHDQAFQSSDAGQAMADLGNGNFVVAWEAREDVDGSGTGAFFRIFNANGTPVTGVVMPYADINPAGTGDQGTPGPIVSGLANGNFVVSWESKQGPGDIGPAPDDQQDIYFRIYSANGTAVTGTTKANSDNTADEEQLNGIIELTGGNFAVLYYRDEDVTGNTDDYFVRTFTPGGVAAGASVEISSGAHVNAYCVVQGNNLGFAALNNGNFAVGWAARDAADGAGDGAYYRVFNATGAAVSTVSLPYADINPAGTGDQSSNGPILKALPDGFTIAWDSEGGPDDVGPALKVQDVYHRVIDNSGIALCASTKTNTGNDAEEEVLVAVQALANGNFAVVYRDDEDATGNLDDYFVRVIGGAPLQNVCPTVGTATVSSSNVCVGLSFSMMVTGLQNMAMAANNEQDYGIEFVAFANSTSDPYSGGTLLGSVAFANLTGGGTTASLTGIMVNTADPDLFIYAILDAAPGDPTCIPFAQTMIAIIDFPTVAFTAPPGLCIDAGVQAGLGSGTPVGGVYSGPGVSDDGNGMSYSFNPEVAGVGTHSITYSYANANGCSANASDNVDVFAAPNGTSITEAICEKDLPFTWNGISCPAAGIYSATLISAAGCDSIITLNLVLNPDQASTTDETICEGDLPFSWNGNSYSAAGTYSVTFVSTVGCDSIATLNLVVNQNVTFAAPADLCINAGVQPGLGGGTPTGGVYSGTGVSDNGNGLTYSFDPEVAGAGTHSITYDFAVSGCIGTASDAVEVFALPTVSISLPDTFFVMNGMPPVNVPGGGLPVGGVYTDMFDEAMDDGNGMTFSFLPNFFIGDTNVITYTYTDINGCSNSASKTVFVADATVGINDLETLQVKIFPNPTTGKINVQGVIADRIEVIDIHGRILSVESHPDSMLDISNLPSGIYFLRMMVRNQLLVEQVVKE